MQIIPVASGKGGVGKSLLSANLGIALGKAGKKVILADLDLGASNLHLVLGQQSPKTGLGAYLSGAANFEDCIIESGYENVRFIPGDSELPGMSFLTNAQKTDLITRFQQCDADYLIIDLGAGTHLAILDFFLLSPQGIIVTSPTVTSILNAYLFLKNAVFRLMYNSFPKDSKACQTLEQLKSDVPSMQKIYIPKLIETLQTADPANAERFTRRMAQFKPRIVLNMIEHPEDTQKALKIRRSCNEYLGVTIEHLGVIYRDAMQDIALASRLPIIVYKPQSILAQAIFRIADKILTAEQYSFEDAQEVLQASFDTAESEAAEDFEAKMSYVEDLIGSGALTIPELAETIRSQQYEITQLKKENTLFKTKLMKAVSAGFTV
ncbi:MAG: P-loop NTPase [Bacteroides sp.]|nr:P-loop NTPase [Prevotella sp.]MCM1407508.1 P-loop NTPase [Treponema brennaborense]MCM1469998.1 P-loop NTPase [Bacteroides sp.]